jgi:hypothetical protein
MADMRGNLWWSCRGCWIQLTFWQWQRKNEQLAAVVELQRMLDSLSLQSVRKSATGDFVLILFFCHSMKRSLHSQVIDWTVLKRFILCRDLVVVSLTCTFACLCVIGFQKTFLHLYEDGYNQCWSGIYRCAPGLSILVARTPTQTGMTEGNTRLIPAPAW